ncbi:MAG: hypothetical protein GY847_09515 [Proteobacteria bacterium]|nr:hypothetical protein [Pseudomonadota bacterium]
MRYVLKPEYLPHWFEYPKEYLRLIQQGLYHFTPWHLLEHEYVTQIYQDLKLQYPSRELFPFAYRQDNDDVACWEREAREKVIVSHCQASPGYETNEIYENFWVWLKDVIEEMIEWE